MFVQGAHDLRSLLLSIFGGVFWVASTILGRPRGPVHCSYPCNGLFSWRASVCGCLLCSSLWVLCSLGSFRACLRFSMFACLQGTVSLHVNRTSTRATAHLPPLLVFSGVSFTHLTFSVHQVRAIFVQEMLFLISKYVILMTAHALKRQIGAKAKFYKSR